MERMTLDGKPLEPDTWPVETLTVEPWRPLSVRESRRAAFKWHWKLLRERVALRLAPWLEP